jgi:nucleoside-diphosphate-sugar epimerase
MIYVIGGTGFVGSAYARLFARLGLEHRVITRATRDEFIGTRCDIVIDCNGNSKKFLAEREPLLDFDMSVRSVAQSLEAFPCDTYVLLSSGDVYPDQSDFARTQEEQVIDPAAVSRYGRHKLLAEQLVRGGARNWLIMRMGGFIGPGLKKNAIFDILREAPVWLSPESELQFISTDRAAGLVWGLIEQGVRREVINLGANGLVNIGKLCDRLGSHSEFRPQAPKVRYELNLNKLARLYDGALPNSEDEVNNFIAQWRGVSPVIAPTRKIDKVDR